MASPAAARLSSRPERADNSQTGSANEAERRAALTRLLRGRGRGGVACLGTVPRKAGRPLAFDWRSPYPIVGAPGLLEAVGGAHHVVPPLSHCPIAYSRALAGRRSGDL